MKPDTDKDNGTDSEELVLLRTVDVWVPNPVMIHMHCWGSSREFMHDVL